MVGKNIDIGNFVFSHYVLIENDLFKANKNI